MRFEFEFKRKSQFSMAGIFLFFCLLVVNAFLLQNYIDGVKKYKVLIGKYDRLKEKIELIGANDSNLVDKERTLEDESVADEINIPWRNFFPELYRICDSNVTILEINPDVASRTLRLSVEARNVNSMFVFLEKLRESKVIQRAHMTQHHVGTDDPMRPLRFRVEGYW